MAFQTPPKEKKAVLRENSIKIHFNNKAQSPPTDQLKTAEPAAGSKSVLVVTEESEMFHRPKDWSKINLGNQRPDFMS